MKFFSDESKLLAKNWETYQELLKAEQTLRTELQDFLKSLEADLVKNPWWNNQWNFIAYDETEIYISNANWVSAYDEYVLLIGLEGFTAERLFGMDNPPLLYIKSSDYSLGEILIEQLKAEENLELGEIDYSSSRYLLTHSLKVLPNEVEKFDKIVRQPVLDFLSSYALLLEKYTEFIDKSLHQSLN
jgi:hypothetical protein